jgi:hypothetical protein
MREKMTRERAETIGLDSLAFLAAMPERIERFMHLSGLNAPALRARASDPDFLRAVLDFLLTEDALVADFCKEHGLDARDIHMAHRMLGEP